MHTQYTRFGIHSQCIAAERNAIDRNVENLSTNTTKHDARSNIRTETCYLDINPFRSVEDYAKIGTINGNSFERVSMNRRHIKCVYTENPVTEAHSYGSVPRCACACVFSFFLSK